MGWPALIFGTVLVVVLWGVATVYFVRQVRALRRLQRSPDLPDHEQAYQRRQSWRRLAGSLLMFLLCVLLAGYLAYAAWQRTRLVTWLVAGAGSGSPAPPTAPRVGPHAAPERVRDRPRG